MNPTYVFAQRRPQTFKEAEIQDFIAMVRAGGEVGGSFLEQNVRNAELLLTVHKGECLVAVAALKKPTLSYRTSIEKKSGVKLNAADLPFEFGYVFVLPSASGQGLATTLLIAARTSKDGIGIFATTRATNRAMAHILIKVGFTKEGAPYASARGRYKLQLFLNQGQSSPLEVPQEPPDGTSARR